MSDKKAQRILEKWVADLKDKDRTRKAVSGNFDELFNELFEAEVDFDTAYELLESAVKAHLPNPGLARKIYKDTKRGKATEKTEREFIDEWNKYIKDCAYQSFYTFFDEEKTPKKDKEYGNMSAREYRTQRKYAESFPEITYEQLLERMKKVEVNLNEELTLDGLEDSDGKAD